MILLDSLDVQKLKKLQELFRHESYEFLLSILESEVNMLLDKMKAPDTPEVDLQKLSEWRGACALFEFLQTAPGGIGKYLEETIIDPSNMRETHPHGWMNGLESMKKDPPFKF